MQYVCIPTRATKMRDGELRVGMVVELRENGNYVDVRDDRGHWKRMRLLQKEALHNL